MPTASLAVGLEWNNAPGGPGVNVWHFRFQNTWGDAEGCVQALSTFYESLKTLYAVGVTIRFPDHAVQVGGDHQEYSNSVQSFFGGTGAGGYAPLPTALVAGWRTSTATRSGRGRSFIGPLAGAVVGPDGTPADDAVAKLQAAATKLVADSKAQNLAALGVYSPTTGLFRDFQSARVRDVFATLRSRRQ